MRLGLRLSGLVALLFITISAASDAAPIKVGLALDKGGRDDKSFNSAAFAGATEAQKKLGVQLKTVESSDDSGLEPSLRTFAQKGFDLVIGIGFVMGEPLKKVASQFPKTKFLIVDSEVKAPNVRSVTFKEHEGSYLVGYLAALTSKTKKVGFVGGMDVPLIHRFEMGYEAGAKAADPKVEVFINYVGSSSDAWRNPTRGKELATSQYNKGVDVIFTAAGASGLGVFDAAEEHKKYAIGVDSNQNWVKPGHILTSMLKRIDVAVLSTVEEATKGKLDAQAVELGVKEGGVDYVIDQHNRALISADTEKKVNEVKKKISEGKISVPDYFKLNKAKG